jgi:acyl-CoA synthetase (AMP-forming)/AMP-acid ligase II
MQHDTLSKVGTLPELLQYRAQQTPHKVGFKFLIDGEYEEQSVTYQELDRSAREIAKCLARLKIAGERALIVYPPGLHFVSAFFGCLYAGITAVPVYPPRPSRLKQCIENLSLIASDAQVSAILTTSKLRSVLQRGINDFKMNMANVRWVTTDQIESESVTPWAYPSASLNPVALLQYTSGSTSSPRGVIVTHENLIHNSSVIYKLFGHSANSVGVIWLPPYHDMGLIGGVLQPLFGGFPVTLLSPFAFLQRPCRWLQAITRSRATISGGPNFAYDLCVRRITPEQRATLDLSSWEVAFNGAESIRNQTLKNFAETFSTCGFRANALSPCYGLAEATLLVSGKEKAAPPAFKIVDRSALQHQQVAPATKSKNGAMMLVGSGQCSSTQDLKIVDCNSLTCCPPDRIGEIWISGASIAQGYWNRPEETRQVFHAYLADTKEGPFLRTGDLGFVCEGQLFVTGRLKDLIVIRGRNYYPEDIELTVEQAHQAIQPAAAAAFALEIQGEERLIVLAELQRPYLSGTGTEEVERAIRRSVSEEYYLEIHRVLLLTPGAIPKTASGKLQRHACRIVFGEAIEGTTRGVATSVRQGWPWQRSVDGRIGSRKSYFHSRSD